PGLGERDAATASDQEIGAQVLLEPRERLAHLRRCHAELPRGAGDRSEPLDDQERLHVVKPQVEQRQLHPYRFPFWKRSCPVRKLARVMGFAYNAARGLPQSVNDIAQAGRRTKQCVRSGNAIAKEARCWVS